MRSYVALCCRLTPSKRWYGTFTEGGKVLDLSYLISLVERPRMRVNSLEPLTPSKWPGIDVRSTVLPFESRDKPPTNEYDMKDFTEGLNLEREEAEGGEGEGEGDTGMGERWSSTSEKELEPLVVVGKDLKTFDDVLGARLSAPNDTEKSIERIRNILKSMSGEVRISSDRLDPLNNERYVSQFQEISFTDLESKNLTMVLAKAYGLEPDDSTKSIFEDSAEKVALTGDGEKPLVVEEEIPTTIDNKISPIIRGKDDSLKEMIVLYGEDLHLLDYGQLQTLATIYKIPTKGSRSNTERQLCKHFNSIMIDGKVPIIHLTHLCEGRKAFVKRKPKVQVEDVDNDIDVDSLSTSMSTGEKEVTITATTTTTRDEWSIEQEQLLVSYAEKVKDARKSIVQAMEAFLSDNNIPNPTTIVEEATATDINLWEVVANQFPGKTPKACRKRWMLIQRMLSVESFR